MTCKYCREDAHTSGKAQTERQIDRQRVLYIANHTIDPNLIIVLCRNDVKLFNMTSEKCLLKTRSSSPVAYTAASRLDPVVILADAAETCQICINSRLNHRATVSPCPVLSQLSSVSRLVRCAQVFVIFSLRFLPSRSNIDMRRSLNNKQ